MRKQNSKKAESDGSKFVILKFACISVTIEIVQDTTDL